MDGNGDNVTFVMEKVSGTPACSTDWKNLAIGCNNGQDLCILNIKETIKSCSMQLTPAECGVNSRTIPLPMNRNDSSYLNNISWSYDGKTVSIETRLFNLDRSLVYTKKVGSTAEWELLYQGGNYYQISRSPKDDAVAIGGIDFINYPKPVILVSGFDPAWAPDGKKIAFIKNSDNSSLEPSGIALLELGANNFSWLYKPQKLVTYGFDTNFIIHDDGSHKLLSWSPDQKFIVFISLTNLGTRSEIFRLTVDTGEIIRLTDKGKTNSNDRGKYYAPAWGPG